MTSRSYRRLRKWAKRKPSNVDSGQNDHEDDEMKTTRKSDKEHRMKKTRSSEKRKGHPKVELKTKHEVDEEVFFTAVEEINDAVAKLQLATTDLTKSNEQAQRAITTEAERRLDDNVRLIIDATNKEAKVAKKLLEELRTEHEELKQQEGLKQSDLRIHENILNAATRKFVDQMKAYQAAQLKYKTDIQKKVERQVRVVNPDATNEQVEEIMRSEGGRDAFFKQAILVGGVSDQIRTVTARIIDKHQAIRAIEQSMAELHQMFLDFGLIVEQQGVLLDNIEHQVMQTRDNIEEGNLHLYKSVEIKKKRIWRKRRMIVFLLMGGALAVVVIVLVL